MGTFFLVSLTKILSSVYLVLLWMDRNSCSLHRDTPDILPKIQRGDPLEFFWEIFSILLFKVSKMQKKITDSKNVDRFGQMFPKMR